MSSDETAPFATDKDIQSGSNNFQAVVNNVTNFIKKCRLKLNEVKSNYTNFTKKKYYYYTVLLRFQTMIQASLKVVTSFV